VFFFLSKYVVQHLERFTNLLWILFPCTLISEKSCTPTCIWDATEGFISERCDVFCRILESFVSVLALVTRLSYRETLVVCSWRRALPRRELRAMNPSGQLDPRVTIDDHCACLFGCLRNALFSVRLSCTHDDQHWT